MSELLAHALREFRLGGLYSGTDEASDRLVSDLTALISIFSQQGHSDSSRAMTLHLFDRLVNFYPLTPLTGRDEEWNQIADYLWQNKRFSAVFKNSTSAWDNARRTVYVYPDGMAVTRSDEEVPYIQFPYMPQIPPMVRVDEDGHLI